MISTSRRKHEGNIDRTNCGSIDNWSLILIWPLIRFDFENTTVHTENHMPGNFNPLVLFNGIWRTAKRVPICFARSPFNYTRNFLNKQSWAIQRLNARTFFPTKDGGASQEFQKYPESAQRVRASQRVQSSWSAWAEEEAVRHRRRVKAALFLALLAKGASGMLPSSHRGRHKPASASLFEDVGALFFAFIWPSPTTGCRGAIRRLPAAKLTCGEDYTLGCARSFVFTTKRIIQRETHIKKHILALARDRLVTKFLLTKGFRGSSSEKLKCFADLLFCFCNSGSSCNN